MDYVLIVGLLLLGIFFMILEIYLIPGISLAGIASVACFIAGISYAFIEIGPLAGFLFLLGSLLVLGLFLYGFYKSKVFDRMALKSEVASRPEPFQGLDVKPGDKGKTVSRLAPIGKIQVGGKTIEGRSENEMLDPGTPVEIVEVGSYNVLVRKIHE